MINWALFEESVLAGQEAHAVLTLLLGEKLMKRIAADHTIKEQVLPRQLLLLASLALEKMLGPNLMRQDAKNKAEAAKAYAAIRAAQKKRPAETALKQMVEKASKEEQ